MQFAVIVFLDTDASPETIINEIVSQLEFEPSTHTVVHSVAVLLDDSTEVGIYERKKENS